MNARRQSEKDDEIKKALPRGSAFLTACDTHDKRDGTDDKN